VIDILASSIVCLYGVNQGILISPPMNDSPTAATPTVPLPVLDVVNIILEARGSKIKVNTIHRHQLWDQVGLSLLVDTIESVSIDEAASLGGVSVEVHKHLKVGFFQYGLLGSQDGWES